MKSEEDMTGPVLFVEADAAVSAKEWDAWLAERGFPSLGALGCLRNGNEKQGWYLPSRFPPQSLRAEEWARCYIGRAVNTLGRVFG